VAATRGRTRCHAEARTIGAQVEPCQRGAMRYLLLLHAGEAGGWWRTADDDGPTAERPSPGRCLRWRGRGGQPWAEDGQGQRAKARARDEDEL
jgi:hypothetical protein